MLVLQCSARLLPQHRLPELREIEFHMEERGEGAVIALSLIDEGKADIFRVLCDDLVGAIGNVASDHEAAQRLMERAYRWHHLLRSSGRGMLSEPEQRGLVAELIVLRDVAIPVLGAESAISAWHGPLGAHQDFVVPGVRVEVKATESRSPRKFSVSSEHQLDRSGAAGDVVSLALVEIARSDHSGAGETLVELVESIRSLCGAASKRASLEYEQRLTAAGFSNDDAYRSTRWSCKAPLCIDVGVDFPSICATALPTAVSRVVMTVTSAGLRSGRCLTHLRGLQGMSHDG